MTTKTQEEIEALKKNWAQDACWDIEDTPGFEEHKEELLAFRKEQEAKWEEDWLATLKERHEKVSAWTGIQNKDLSQVIHTQKEIEEMVKLGERDESLIVIEAAQVRATLLLATQLQRIANSLEAMESEDDGSALINSAKIWGSEL